MSLESTRKHHAGELICTARNSVGQASKQFSLIVVDPPSTSTSLTIVQETLPSLSISPSHLLLDYGERFELICHSNLVHPFDIHWLFNGRFVAQRQLIRHMSDRSLLRIERASDEHTGIYQCFSNQTLAGRVITSMPVTLTVRRKCRVRSLLRVENCNHSFARSTSSKSQSSDPRRSTSDGLL